MSQLTGPLASPSYFLHKAALAWRREFGIRLRPHGLTPTQFDALASLSWIGHTVDEPTQQAPLLALIEALPAPLAERLLIELLGRLVEPA